MNYVFIQPEVLELDSRITSFQIVQSIRASSIRPGVIPKVLSIENPYSTALAGSISDANLHLSALALTSDLSGFAAPIYEWEFDSYTICNLLFWTSRRSFQKGENPEYLLKQALESYLRRFKVNYDLIPWNWRGSGSQLYTFAQVGPLPVLLTAAQKR